MQADTATIAEQNARNRSQKLFLQAKDIQNFVGGYNTEIGVSKENDNCSVIHSHTSPARLFRDDVSTRSPLSSSGNELETTRMRALCTDSMTKWACESVKFCLSFSANIR